MVIPDADIYPHAKGEALKTASEHEATQDLLLCLVKPLATSTAVLVRNTLVNAILL